MPNYFQIGQAVLDMKFFLKIFLLVAMATRILHGIEIPRIIPVRFGEITSSLRDVI